MAPQGVGHSPTSVCTKTLSSDRSISVKSLECAGSRRATQLSHSHLIVLTVVVEGRWCRPALLVPLETLRENLNRHEPVPFVSLRSLGFGSLGVSKLSPPASATDREAQHEKGHRSRLRHRDIGRWRRHICEVKLVALDIGHREPDEQRR